MPSSTGQAKRSSGGKNASSPRPLANHTTISLAMYMRESVAVMATNRLSVRMVGKCPSTVKPITSMISDGFTCPAEAWPSVRISIIVITMVTSTTKVAPKLRPSSLRKDESNNISL